MQVHQSDENNHRDGGREGLDSGKKPVQIRSKGQGAQGHRGGEANHDGHHASHKAEGGMVNLPEKMIFTTGARECGREFGVAQGPAQGEDAPEAPEDHDRRARRDFADLKTEAGEDAGADHVGHDECGAGGQSDGAWRRHGPGGSPCA